MILDRLRNDFHLAILSLMGAIAVLGILPFAIYRFASGDLIAGAVDVAILVCIVGSSAYAWLTGKTRLATVITTIMTMLGCVVIALLLGRDGLPWMYGGILAAFLLLKHAEAALASAIAALVVSIHGGPFQTSLQALTFLATTLVVATFAFTFAYRAEQLRKQTQLLATRDPLTGVANRRSMEDEMALAIETSRRTGRPCGLAMLDLDRFKQINDCHGHKAGDEVLVDFVRLVRSSTRKADRIFRYGGEEFVLLLPGADHGALRTIAENLRLQIELCLHCKGEPVTVSIGAASLRADEPWESSLERADSALYRAKEAGRNRVVVEVDAARPAPALSAEA